jgi:ribosomal protein S18 acetylase RimI-like enzyme
MLASHDRHAIGAYGGPMQNDDATASVEIATLVDHELVAAFERLIPQLSSSSPPPGVEALTALVDGADTDVFLARVDGEIVGTLTLAFYRIPTGIKAWIEDVVVDDAARGHGVGRLLNEAALDQARRRGAKNVSLTSRPSREAANRLYQRIGFQPRETNLYRYDF